MITGIKDFIDRKIVPGNYPYFPWMLSVCRCDHEKDGKIPRLWVHYSKVSLIDSEVKCEECGRIQVIKKSDIV